jgi:hypothetical protein
LRARWQVKTASWLLWSRVVDPDPDSVTLWIRIRIGNPEPGSGSRGKKVRKFQWKMHYKIKYKIAL